MQNSKCKVKSGHVLHFAFKYYASDISIFICNRTDYMIYRKKIKSDAAFFMNKNNVLTAYISEYDMNSESLTAFYENSENRSKKNIS